MSRRSLWPREHGAYFQLAIPLVTALALRVPGPAAIALAVAACLGFLAHEPLLVLAGVRGPRMLRRDGTRARRRLIVLGCGAVIAGVAGLVLAPPAARLAAALLLVPVAIVLALALRRAEHTVAGELIAAVALTGAAWPVAIAGGTTTTGALVIWLGWALGFAASVVAVHRVIARHKRPAARLDTALAVALVAAGAACIALAPRSAAGLIAAPLVCLAAVLVIAPPSASRLRALGVAIAVAAAASAALVLLAA